MLGQELSDGSDRVLVGRFGEELVKGTVGKFFKQEGEGAEYAYDNGESHPCPHGPAWNFDKRVLSDHCQGEPCSEHDFEREEVWVEFGWYGSIQSDYDHKGDEDAGKGYCFVELEQQQANCHGCEHCNHYSSFCVHGDC